MFFVILKLAVSKQVGDEKTIKPLKSKFDPFITAMRSEKTSDLEFCLSCKIDNKLFENKDKNYEFDEIKRSIVHLRYPDPTNDIVKMAKIFENFGTLLADGYDIQFSLSLGSNDKKREIKYGLTDAKDPDFIQPFFIISSDCLKLLADEQTKKLRIKIMNEKKKQVKTLGVQILLKEMQTVRAEKGRL